MKNERFALWYSWDSQLVQEGILSNLIAELLQNQLVQSVESGNLGKKDILQMIATKQIST